MASFSISLSLSVCTQSDGSNNDYKTAYPRATFGFMTIGENGMNTGNRRRMMIVMMIVQRNLFYAGLVE
jgi:hypothetical protein